MKPMDGRIYSGKLNVTWENLKLLDNGLIPVVVQDVLDDRVLMLAYMNKEAWEKTLETGLMTYYSRSRSALWVKGESSGHYQFVRELRIDCDSDTILAKVFQEGVACHTGAKTCFYREVEQI